MPSTRPEYDAVVVGSGPNGLAAAITIARTGRSVVVLEAEDEIGGGTRSAELTLPGFLHDVCSAAHPMAVASPFFRDLPLADHGLEWIHPAAPVAHPLDDGSVAIGERSVGLTSVSLGEDEDNYRDLMMPLVAAWPQLESVLTGPLSLARHPIAGARFAWLATQPAEKIAAHHFRGARARAFFAGLAAHSVLPLNRVPSGAFALVLGIALHAVGWPFARGGSKNIAAAMASYLRLLGGEIFPGMRVESLKQIPRAGMIFCDVTPRQLLEIAGPSCRPNIAATWKTSTTARESAKSTGRSTPQSRGRTKLAFAPARFISAARWRKLPWPSALPGRANAPKSLSSCSPSLRCSIHPARRPESTSPGPTGACPTVRIST